MTMNQVVAAVVSGAVASVTIVEREGLLVPLHRPTSKYRISRKKERKKERKKATTTPYAHRHQKNGGGYLHGKRRRDCSTRLA